MPDNGQVVRLDYSAEAWTEAPENAIGFWKSRIPDADSKKVNWAPNDVMLDYFIRLEEEPTKRDVRFVLALLLLRRRVLRLDDSSQDQPQEMMLLHCSRNESEYRVSVVSPEMVRIKEIQEELAHLLFGNEA